MRFAGVVGALCGNQSWSSLNPYPVLTEPQDTSSGSSLTNGSSIPAAHAGELNIVCTESGSLLLA